jgi:hypothetical protein
MKKFKTFLNESPNIDTKRIYKMLHDPRSPQEPTLKRNIDIWVDDNYTSMKKKDIAAKYGLTNSTRIRMISQKISRMMRGKGWKGK